MSGIIGYGSYIPKYRIKVESIAAQWGADAKSFKSGLREEEKSVLIFPACILTISFVPFRL